MNRADVPLRSSASVYTTKAPGPHRRVAACGVFHAHRCRPDPYCSPLYFTRHGRSEYNTLGKIGGDSSLSKEGQRIDSGRASVPLSA